MAESGLLVLFVGPMNRAGIGYLVTGGIATIVYGEPRFTRDIDLVLAVGPSDAARFLSLWPPGEFYALPREVFETESARAAHAGPVRDRHRRRTAPTIASHRGSV